MANCLGSKLSDYWWRDPEQLHHELKAHGTLSAAGAHHGVNDQTLSDWWRKLRKQGADLPELPRGSRASRVNAATTGEISEVDQLRQRVLELQKAVLRERDKDVFQERVIGAMERTLEKKKPSYAPKKPKTSSREAHEFVLLWSDTHAGEVVSREETNGLNEYDWKTMMRRHDEILRGVVSYRQNRPYPVNTLHILGLGDMLSGNIHDELAETNEFPLVETAVQFGLDAAEWLEGFIPHFARIRFAGVVGNHPRMHRKPRAKQKFDNFDWVVYRIMEQRLSGYPSVTFDVPKAQHWPVEVAGRRLLMYHGDGIRSTMVDVPWGGIIRHTSKLRNQYATAGQPIDHFVCGHYHEASVVKNRRIIMNGSVKGIDEYSMQQFGGGEPPCQLLLTFHPKRGLVETCYLDLEPKHVRVDA